MCLTVTINPMLKPQDIQKLTEVLATKEDIKALDERVSHLEETQDRILSILDNLTKRVEDMHAEYVAVRMTMERHERWIKEIADKAGVTLTA